MLSRKGRLLCLIFLGFTLAMFTLFTMPLDRFIKRDSVYAMADTSRNFIKNMPKVPSFPLTDLTALSQARQSPLLQELQNLGRPLVDVQSDTDAKLIQQSPFRRGSFVLDKKFVTAELANFTSPTIEDLIYVLQQEKGFDEKPPDHFLQDWKNPCWYGSTNVSGTNLKCLPYFYILGFPKCATTDLWQRVKLHPQIEENVPKETHWWSRLRYDGAEKSMGQYYAGELFGKHMMENLNKSSKRWILADGSPSYIYESHNEIRYKMINEIGYMHLDPPTPKVLVGHLIKHYTPKAKFVVMLRNPTDRIFSHHVYFGTKEYKRDFTFRRSPRKLHYLVLRMINLYKQCFSERPVRECMYNPTLYRECEESKVRIDRSLYAVYISDWLKIFPRDQFFIITLNEYSDDDKRREILKNLFTFLELPPVKKPLLEKMVSQTRAVAKNKDPAVKSMRPETRVLLNNFFRPFNEALVDLLGDKKYLFEDEVS